MNYQRLLTTLTTIAVLLVPALTLAQMPADGENEYRLAAVNKGATTTDTLTADAGRGIWVADNPDLDGDGLPEIIVTEYTMGGRVFVYEVIGNDLLEFVWASPPLDPVLPGGGSTPRSVTTGDFDNNGFQEIIFPVGYLSADSLEFANRGLYFFEHTGADNDYGTAPAYKMTYESIDPLFADVSTGRTESGIRCRDIDGDGRNELLFPPRSFAFSVAKLYIMQATSGTFSGGDVVIENEYVYEAMVQVPDISPDGYVPVGTDIGDIDGDGLDEIIVAGWQNIGSGAGLGFIQINGPDSYTDGSVVRLADFSAFVVKATPLFAEVDGEPVVYLHGTNASNSASQMWVLANVVSDQFISDNNIIPLLEDVGFWSAWSLGDQDHGTGNDGIDLYLYDGSGRFVDVEFEGGDVTDVNNYTVHPVYNLADHYDNLGGLFNSFYSYPGMDLDNDGLRDLAVSYKGSSVDMLEGVSLAKNGFHVFMFEFGDSLNSIELMPVTDINLVTRTIMPEDYKLAQNYPNPFNPSTTIGFSLPISKSISLKIYNTLGQEVRTLINNQRYGAGAYEATWDGVDNSGSQVASGVYLYKLVYGNFSQAKTMVLVR